MRWLQVLKRCECGQAERINVVIATAVEDVRPRTRERKDILVLLTFIQRTTVRLTQVVA